MPHDDKCECRVCAVSAWNWDLKEYLGRLPASKSITLPDMTGLVEAFERSAASDAFASDPFRAVLSELEEILENLDVIITEVNVLKSTALRAMTMTYKARRERRLGG